MSIDENPIDFRAAYEAFKLCQPSFFPNGVYDAVCMALLMASAKTKEQPDESLLLQDVIALRKHGSALVDSLEGLQGEYMVKHAAPLFDLQWWEFAKTRIENWKRYLRALDRDGVRTPERESGVQPKLLPSKIIHGEGRIGDEEP
jgi:hypothetical protein